MAHPPTRAPNRDRAGGKSEQVNARDSVQLHDLHRISGFSQGCDEAFDLSGIARDITITTLDAEPCACAALYPEARGDKTEFTLG